MFLLLKLYPQWLGHNLKALIDFSCYSLMFLVFVEFFGHLRVYFYFGHSRVFGNKGSMSLDECNLLYC